ncbi:MAG: hypothetical protein RBR09_11880 [Desulfobulbaceae bacterium]|jgi:CBS domain containing-hemolysin-like protein|nr:hypothetical protein [Desulfobulbaceae bacterium]MDY0351946.1 hypothetical protein [Desulfobulbaceae bacterium]
MNGEGAAFYARRGTRLADLWTLLHPPYTAWNMSYVAIGAALAPTVDWQVLAIMLLAFFSGTGIAAHALDEYNGRPLQTGFSDRELQLLAAGGLILPAILTVILIQYTSPMILSLLGAGTFLVLAYNLEWWRGLFHSDLGFALSWGAFPVIAGYWTQSGTISGSALAGAAAAALFSLAQRSLSTQARFVRRKTRNCCALFNTEEKVKRWEKDELLNTWEKPLRLLAWAVTLLAIGLLVGKME